MLLRLDRVAGGQLCQAPLRTPLDSGDQFSKRRASVYVLLDVFRGLGGARTARVVCTERDGEPRVTTPPSSLRSPLVRGCSRSRARMGLRVEIASVDVWATYGATLSAADRHEAPQT
jgi:hypothetical protein